MPQRPEDCRVLEDLDSYLVLPSLNDNQGIMGALKLGMDRYQKNLDA